MVEVLLVGIYCNGYSAFDSKMGNTIESIVSTSSTTDDEYPWIGYIETTQLAKRWTGPAALAAGVAQETAPLEEIRGRAIARAAALARLGANRALFRWNKEAIYGENAAINGPHGPAFMLRNSHLYERFGS